MAGGRHVYALRTYSVRSADRRPGGMRWTHDGWRQQFIAGREQSVAIAAHRIAIELVLFPVPRAVAGCDTEQCSDESSSNRYRINTHR